MMVLVTATNVSVWPNPQTAPWAAIRRTDRDPLAMDDIAATWSASKACFIPINSPNNRIPVMANAVQLSSCRKLLANHKHLSFTAEPDDLWYSLKFHDAVTSRRAGSRV